MNKGIAHVWPNQTITWVLKSYDYNLPLLFFLSIIYFFIFLFLYFFLSAFLSFFFFSLCLLPSFFVSFFSILSFVLSLICSWLSQGIASKMFVFLTSSKKYYHFPHSTLILNRQKLYYCSYFGTIVKLQNWNLIKNPFTRKISCRGVDS